MIKEIKIFAPFLLIPFLLPMCLVVYLMAQVLEIFYKLKAKKEGNN